MLQNLVVILIGIAAVLYLAWRYLPTGLRQRLGRVHPSLAQGPGGCGSGASACSSCGGCAKAAPAVPVSPHPPLQK